MTETIIIFFLMFGYWNLVLVCYLEFEIWDLFFATIFNSKKGSVKSNMKENEKNA